MRIIFAGTPEYAVPSLKALVGLAPEHHVVGVVTQPDRPLKRSKAPIPPPVKAAALELGIPLENIFQPKSINQPEQLELLQGLEPDLMCVVAYGGLLKRAALDLAKKYPINAHGSLLPLYRGAAPLQAAIMSGDAQTGVCIMKMAEKLDNGPVMLQREMPIRASDTAGTLHDRMAELSAACFLDAISLIEKDAESFVEQDESKATFAKKLSKKSGQMDWALTAVQLERFVRAMSPWPGAWTKIRTLDGNETQKVIRVRVSSAKVGVRKVDAPDSNRGRVTIVEVETDSTGNVERALEVSCGSETLLIASLQPEGRKVMTVDSFLRGAGRSFLEGAQFE